MAVDAIFTRAIVGSVAVVATTELDVTVFDSKPGFDPVTRTEIECPTSVEVTL